VAWRSKLRLTHAKYLGKAELFKGPFGFIFRKLGGFPVERSEKHNMVDQVVHLLTTHDSFTLVLSPEGTRKKVDRLRTGFYYIAKKRVCRLLWRGSTSQRKKLLFQNLFLQRMMKRPIFNISTGSMPHQRKKTGTGHGASSNESFLNF
jgi:hypothetical protein